MKKIIDRILNKDFDLLENLDTSTLHKTKTVLEDIKDIAEKADCNQQASWNNINRALSYKKPKHTISTIMQYAASIIVVALVSYMSYFIYNDITNQTIATVPKQKEINQPVLILSNGRMLDLSIQNDSLITDDNLIKVENKTLSYNQIKDTNIVRYNTIVVPRAAEYSIRLSDGTLVKLNADSKLRYPTRFSGGIREVELEGEAYFDVRKSKKPFIVISNNVKVKVLGTIFNVNAYNNKIATTLVEGKVRVQSGKMTTILTPNQQAIVEGGNINRYNVDASKFIGWVSGNFYFEDETLESISNTLERWYDIEVFFVTQDAKDITFTGVIKRYMTLKDVVEILAKSSKMKMQIKNKSLFIKMV